MSDERPPRGTDDEEKGLSPKVISVGVPCFEAFPPPAPARRSSPHGEPGGGATVAAGRPTQKGWPKVSTAGPEPEEVTVVLSPEPAAAGSGAASATGTAADGAAAGPGKDTDGGTDGPLAAVCEDVGPEPRPGVAGPAPADLPVWLRVTLIAIGLVLLAVGVAGLVLPGLQGILTILLGLALLSLVSHPAYRFLCWCLGPWPKLRDRVMGYRVRTFGWLNTRLGSAGASAVGPEEATAGEVDRPDPQER